MAPLSQHFSKYLLIIIFLSVGGGFFCSLKDSPTTPADKPKPKVPTLNIYSPSIDTLVDNSVDSVLICAAVTNTDIIDSFVVNNIKIPRVTVTGDTLKCKLKLPKDTLKIKVSIFYQMGTSISDSVTIIKRAPVVTFNGLAKISGTLLQPSNSSLAKKLSKKLLAANAQGVQEEITKVIPISGADVMVYNAEALSTTSDTIVRTDSSGHWTVEMKPGNYFVFAVYFDRINLEIVTTSLPDIKAIKDVETKTDTSIAISDDISPMCLTFLDAAEANDKNMFIANSIPTGLPIVMSFSEPMTRASVGDSVRGIILGSVNSDSSELTLLDTVPVKKLWSPDGKELRLLPTKPLVTGKTYKVVIPSGCKDLALNKLVADYAGIFEVIQKASLPPFAVKTTAPLNNDTIPAGFPVECIFNRPVDILSLNKSYALKSISDTSVSVFFEVKGNSAKLVNKKIWMAGAVYTLTLDASVKDIAGDSLGNAFVFSFCIQQRDTFEQKVGIEGTIAAAVKKFMGAYIAGDLETFSQSFHPSFEMIENLADGNISRVQLASFLDKMRTEIDERNRLAKFGIISPVFYYPEVGGTRYIAWKLIKNLTSVYFEDLGPDGNIGKIPHVFTMDMVDITSKVHYVNRGIVYNGETLYFAPDMSKAFISENARQNDPSIFGKLLKSSTNVQTQEIMLSSKSDFVLKSIHSITGKDTAQAMIELIQEEKFLDGKRPEPIRDPSNPPPDVQKRVSALQAKLVLNNGRWMVIQIAVKELYSGNKAAFTKDVIKDTAFVIRNFEQTRSIEFISPKQKSVSVPLPIVLQWSVLKTDGIGGYLVVISNEMSGGNQGLLIFTRKSSLTISETGSIDSSAYVLAIDPKAVTIPIPRFSSRLTSFTAADKQVYTWKVIGIPDSTHSSLSATSIKVIADSDFGSHNGIGIFTLADRMPDFASQIVQNPIVQNNPVDQFSDRDNDMFPDWLEKAFGTSPDDPGSYPNFTLDSDQDGYADFLELFSGSKVDNAESKPQDTDPADLIPDMLQKRPEWRPELAFDDDKDGFPNQIEMIFRTDPRNNTSKPSISIKASAPVGTYFGGIRLNGQNWKRINFSLLSDTTGDFVFVDTTELEGIARNGVDLSVNCIWNNGEWVFYLGIVNGPNSGKFIKVRFHREGNNLRGPIDLADSKNGGGPYIGEFFASMDSIKDFNNLTNGLTNPIIINQNPQGTVNIGPPPADQVKRPDSGSVDMKLVMTFTVGEIPNVKVVLPDDSIFSDKPFWAPGQFPSLGFNLPGSTKQYRIEGNYHKINNPNGDTLVLVGIIEFNQNNPSGGTFRQAFNFVVFTTGITDLRKPGGTWTGWYRKPFASTNIQQGPKPYIGSKDSVNAALAKTQNAGIIMETQQIVTFSSAVQQPNTNVWTVKVDTSTFFIMEKVGDFLNVMIKVIDGKQYIVLSKGTSVQQNPNTNPQPPVFFTGDSSVVVAALVQAHDTVKIATQIPIIIMINPQSLHREISPQTGMPGRWVANDLKNANHQIVFLANPANPQQLQIEQNRPVVNDVVIQQNPNTDPQNPITNPLQPVFFKGDSSMIIAALALVNDSVKIAAPNPIFIRVNRVTVRREASPQPDQPGRWIADDIVNVNHKIAFLANPANPLQLLLEQNKPVVHDVVMQPAGIVPFTGDTSLVRTVLNSSNNQIVLVGNSNPITINPASLVKMVDPQNPDNVGYIVSAAGNPIDRFLFLGQEQNPSMLKMNGQTPVCSKVTI